MPQTKHQKSEKYHNEVQPPAPGLGAELPPVYDLVADAVADLLARGDHPEDVDNLLRAVSAHIARRGLSPKEPPLDAITALVETWKGQLAEVWRRNSRDGAPAIDTSTISNRIRANTRRRLEDWFQQFLNEAKQEEIWLLSEILCTWYTGISDEIPGVDEVPLAEAFAWHLDGNETYVRVPKQLREKVQVYADAMRAASELV